MPTPYDALTVEQKKRFQTLIAHQRALRSALWNAVQAAKAFNAQLHAVQDVGADLEAPAAPIIYDVDQDAVLVKLGLPPRSIWCSDPSWNDLINEHAFADAFLATENGLLAMYRAAIGSDLIV